MLTQSQKIDELLELAGIPEFDRDGVRKNFENLAPSVIDQRLNKLKRAEKTISAWRASRGRETQHDYSTSPPIAPEVQPQLISQLEHDITERLSAALDGPAAEIRRDLEEIETISEKLVDSLKGRPEIISEKHWEIKNLAKLTKAVSNLGTLVADNFTRNVTAPRLHTAESNQAKTDGKLAKDLEDFMKSTTEVAQLTAYINSRMKAIQFREHPPLPETSDHRSLLSMSSATDAFARIENFISRNEPDMFIAANAEGATINHVIRHHLNFREKPVIIVAGDSSSDLHWISSAETDSQPLRTPKVVCVVGHLARTGATMAKIIKETKSRYSAERVYGVVLAASEDAINTLDEFSVEFHNRATWPDIELSFDPSEDVQIADQGYIFRGTRNQNETLLEKSLSTARIEMNRAYPHDTIKVQ